MRRLILSLFTFGLHISSGLTLGADRDPILLELEKAKETQQEARAKARASLIAGFDDTIKAVAQTGDLDAVKVIRAEKKAFEDGEKIPGSAKMGAAASEYTKATRAAKVVLDKAYEKAIKDATKGLKIELAEAIREDWRVAKDSGMEVKPPKKEVKPPSPKPAVTTMDDLKKYLTGTVWAWGDGFDLKFKGDGYCAHEDWERNRFVTRWEVIDRRTVALVIEKGREHNLIAILRLTEDLHAIAGYNFAGDQLKPFKRKR